MTTHSHHLRLTTVNTQDGVRTEVHGDLDYDSANLLLNEVSAQISARPALTDLHLHCAELGTVDSMGLSILLMIGRRTAKAGIRLHLDDRPANLDRLLRLTGTLDHLTAPPLTGAVRSSPTEGSVVAARPIGPDGTT
ncbi:STAS domain-containing protein [Streptomyces halstedii]|uniref:STAS domain-containing protein n=1 Tax=Streptomyces TaxID=1883 RepID=UPI0004A9179D|nr:STAS domain-containing protein [Streptomyces sp. NTK 937]KDQ67134.1 sulfate transporter [Streptomyces sp. NTK 937]WSX38313.1 STAS domain-containing protein [Streptomyces halstedii]